MMPFFAKNISSLSDIKAIQGSMDSVIVKRIITINENRNILNVKSDLISDSALTKNFLYNRMIQKEGESIKEYIKPESMIYTPQVIRSQTVFKKNNSDSYIFSELYYEKRITYNGNGKDNIHIVKILSK